MASNINKKKYLIIVAGPTASGKTSLSIQLAQHFNTAILSCDSRQFFKEMNIGTAKPNAHELAQVKHYFINHRSIKETYSVGDYEKEAIALLKQLYQQHNVAIMVGGSGLYFRAVCEGLDTFPHIPTDMRNKVKAMYQQGGLKLLQQTLQQQDPTYYQEVDIKNPQRLMRAIEVCLQSGKPYSSFRQQSKKQRFFTPIKIAINWDRQQLYQRINTRVDAMMDKGLLQEVQSLYSYKHVNALQTVGYNEIFRFLDGDIDLPEAIRLIKRNTRHYAKRQLTWLRKEADINWYAPENIHNIITDVEKIIQ